MKRRQVWCQNQQSGISDRVTVFFGYYCCAASGDAAGDASGSCKPSSPGAGVTSVCGGGVAGVLPAPLSFDLWQDAKLITAITITIAAKIQSLIRALFCRCLFLISILLFKSSIIHFLPSAAFSNGKKFLQSRAHIFFGLLRFILAFQ